MSRPGSKKKLKQPLIDKTINTNKLKQLENSLVGKKAVILGNGRTVKEFRETDAVTFGVNDINKFYSPDYHVIVDRAGKFNDKRIAEIKKTKAKFILTQANVGWVFPKNQYTYLLGKFRSFENFKSLEKVDYGLDSPYMCAHIAYKLGVRKMAMIGVDFYAGHFYSENDGDHQLVRIKRIDDVINIYANLYKKFKDEGVEIYNLASKSRIISIPSITWEEFEKL